MNLSILSAVLVAFIGAAHAARAQESAVKFNYHNAEIAAVIEDYAKYSGQKFVVDAAVRGKVTILNPQKISPEEAFAQLSTALMTNGLGISRQSDVMVVQQARSTQRSFIDVGTTLPPLRPDHMFTWVIDLKHIDAEEMNNQLRILTSKDGELVPVKFTNQILVTDWVSNLHRIQKIIEAVDRPGRLTKSAATAPEPVM